MSYPDYTKNFEYYINERLDSAILLFLGEIKYRTFWR